MDSELGSRKRLFGDRSSQDAAASMATHPQLGAEVAGGSGGGNASKGIGGSGEERGGEEGYMRRFRKVGLADSVGEVAQFYAGTCHCAVTKEMASMETKLQLALVGSVTGSAMCVTVQDIMRAAEVDAGVAAACLGIFRTGPSVFLIKCSSIDVMDQLLSAEKIKGNGFCVDLKRWSREEGSIDSTMGVKVQIKMFGLPAHAWDEAFVRAVLEEYCWVEVVHMCRFLEGDMSKVVVDAWAANAESIPSEKDLAIPEPLVGTMLEVSSLVTPPWSIRKLKKYPIQLETEVVAYSPLPDVNPDRFGSDSGDDGCPTEPFCYSSSSRGYESLQEYDSDREPYAWKREGC